MPRSATFTVTPASPHSSVHNSRNEKPNYLISQLKIKDKVVDNFYDLRYSDSEFLVLAKAKYKEVTRQKMQQKQIIALIKETVLTLEAHHTEYDVQKVFDILNKKYGGHNITELTIHRDEGHFEDENGITYYPTKDIIEKEDGWYIIPLSESMNHSPEYRPKAEEFREKIDIDKFMPIHNIHAHVKFSMYDLTIGKTGRMKHKDLNDRIRTAALVLDLEYNPEKKNAKRVTVADKKAQHKAVRNEKVRNFFENGHVIEETNTRIIDLERIVAEQQQELHRRTIEIKELELERMSKNAKIVMLATKNRKFEQLHYNSRETQKHISALETLNEEQKKDLLRLNTELNKIKIDDDEKRERLDQLRHKINSIAHLLKIYPKDMTYEVDDKLLDAIQSRTKTGIEARNELQTAKKTISTQLVEIERLNALVNSRESKLGEIDGLINAGATIHEVIEERTHDDLFEKNGNKQEFNDSEGATEMIRKAHR